MIVGVYDSGLGGVDILDKLINKYPNHTYIYVCDNKYCPYGIKTNEELQHRIDKVMNFFSHQKVDIVVIACNTVSNLIYKNKEKYEIPIYTILESNIDLIKNKGIHNICVIGTSNLIRSEVFSKELDCDIQYLNGSLLVKLIEENNLNEIEKEIRILMKYVHKDRDAVLLSCTHFPLYKNIFMSRDYNKIILDGSKDLVYSLPLSKNNSIQSIHIFLTKNDISYAKIINNILKDYRILIHNISL